MPWAVDTVDMLAEALPEILQLMECRGDLRAADLGRPGTPKRVASHRLTYPLGSVRPSGVRLSRERRVVLSVASGTRAALYHRVSTVDQNQHAARTELRVVLDVRETGSGANNQRPGLVKILEAAQRGDVNAVLVCKLDRFGRSAFDLLGNIRQLEAAGVRFVAVTQGIDIRPSGDPMSRLLLTMLSAVAEFERDLVVERTRLGLANARRAGRRLGRPPLALPATATVQQLKASGATWAGIADQLKCTVWAARMAAKKVG